ncbi:uncharacterized protein LOC106155631 [Lingula anatina]|uniref:Uncharacterized protein LOC106155631 n=1 Tax=Lingula anatina TaxID=7574 RepID=A0A1S3HKK3_LINAN|nr:uncharacterized protein LOC106155631 [Lingula anatina]|eukprot:XP_013385996.1 uncharacterized protein LOC106155631 [Lingula anatina]
MADKGKHAVISSSTNLSELSVTELRKELEKRKLPKGGTKAKLIQRLSEVLKTEEENITEDASAAEEVSEEQLLGEDKAGGDMSPVTDDVLNESDHEGEKETEAKDSAKGEPAKEEDEKMDTTENGTKEAEDKGSDEVPTEQEKAEAEKANSAKKAADQKKEKDEEKSDIVTPTRRTMNLDLREHRRMCTVLVGPVLIEEMAKPEVLSLMKDAQLSVNRFYKIDGKDLGVIECIYKSFAEAAEYVEKFNELSWDEDNCEVQHAAEHTTGNPKDPFHDIPWPNAFVNKHLQPLTKLKANQMQLHDVSMKLTPQMIYVHDSPLDSTEEQVREAFSNVLQVIIPVDNKGTQKGYLYMAFDSEAEAQCVLEDEGMGKKYKINGKDVTVHGVEIDPKMKKPFNAKASKNRDPTTEKEKMAKQIQGQSKSIQKLKFELEQLKGTPRGKMMQRRQQLEQQFQSPRTQQQQRKGFQMQGRQNNWQEVKSPGTMGQRPMGQKPMGQRPMAQRPMAQRPMGQRPMGQRDEQRPNRFNPQRAPVQSLMHNMPPDTGPGPAGGESGNVAANILVGLSRMLNQQMQNQGRSGRNMGDGMGGGMGNEMEGRMNRSSGMGSGMGSGAGGRMGGRMDSGMGGRMDSGMGGRMDSGMGGGMGGGMREGMGNGVGSMGSGMGGRMGSGMGGRMGSGMGGGIGSGMGGGMGSGLGGGMGSGMGGGLGSGMRGGMGSSMGGGMGSGMGGGMGSGMGGGMGSGMGGRMGGGMGSGMGGEFGSGGRAGAGGGRDDYGVQSDYNKFDSYHGGYYDNSVDDPYMPGDNNWNRKRQGQGFMHGKNKRRR